MKTNEVIHTFLSPCDRHCLRKEQLVSSSSKQLVSLDKKISAHDQASNIVEK